jgi:nucleoside-diphosphate-sugar epimerase
MKVLLTDRSGLFGEALARALSTRHEVETFPLASGVDDPRAITAADLAGIDAVVFRLPEPLPENADRRAENNAVDFATRGIYNLLTRGHLKRFVLISNLRHFERYPIDWYVTERWAPRPTTDVNDLVPFLAEETVREVTRVIPTLPVVLRMGEIVDDATATNGDADPRWLHVEDAIQAVERALTFDPEGGASDHGWQVFHIVDGAGGSRFPLGAAGEAPFGYAPAHAITPATFPSSDGDQNGQQRAASTPKPRPRAADQPPRVVIFGAGGPMGAAAAKALAPDHQLRLTDIRSLAEIKSANKPQAIGAPLPEVYGPPHEDVIVDVTDPDQVAAAVQGMDVVVNCTVIRPDPVNAFLVNTIGAYNIVDAAVAQGIPRMVQTGPEQAILAHPAGYAADFGLDSNLPPRPGDNLYFVSKYLGQEICRVYAEETGIEIPTLLFNILLDQDETPQPPLGIRPFTISRRDTGTILRAAVDVPTLPRPFIVMHGLADLPHGQYSNERAKTVLNWQPQDRLERFYRRPTLAERAD